MAKFSESLPGDIESFFERSNQPDSINLINFKFDDLKSLSIIQLAKFKFFEFSKIICGFLYASESSNNTKLYFEKNYEALFDELIQQWLYLLYSKDLFEKISLGIFIELPFFKELDGLKIAFRAELQCHLQSSENISIVMLYKVWIKNLDKYYENLLTHSIDLLDSNNVLDNLRKLND
jgi:hypothetical protein